VRLTESEWQIMNALWQGHPATARDLRERLPADVRWAHTTIKTLLARLVAKGAVSESKRGNTSIYEPLVTQNEARRSSLRAFLKQAFDGGVEPFLSFLAKDKSLTPRQREQLARILEEESERKRGGK
jgi:BlaI family transcriptional regulator, penicillinase repressor